MGLTGRSLGKCQEKKTFNEKELAVAEAKKAGARYGEPFKTTVASSAASTTSRANAKGMGGGFEPNPQRSKGAWLGALEQQTREGGAARRLP